MKTPTKPSFTTIRWLSLFARNLWEANIFDKFQKSISTWICCWAEVNLVFQVAVTPKWYFIQQTTKIVKSSQNYF